MADGNIRAALEQAGYLLDGVESPFPLARLSGKILGLERDIETGIIEDFAVVPSEQSQSGSRSYDIYFKPRQQ